MLSSSVPSCHSPSGCGNDGILSPGSSTSAPQLSSTASGSSPRPQASTTLRGLWLGSSSNTGSGGKTFCGGRSSTTLRALRWTPVRRRFDSAKELDLTFYLQIGTIFCFIFIFFTLQYPKGGVTLSWWGNEVWANSKHSSSRSLPGDANTPLSRGLQPDGTS